MNGDFTASRIERSALVCSTSFLFRTMVAFFSTFIAYTLLLSGPRFFRTRNTLPYPPCPITWRRSKCDGPTFFVGGAAAAAASSTTAGASVSTAASCTRSSAGPAPSSSPLIGEGAWPAVAAASRCSSASMRLICVTFSPPIGPMIPRASTNSSSLESAPFASPSCSKEKMRLSACGSSSSSSLYVPPGWASAHSSSSDNAEPMLLPERPPSAVVLLITALAVGQGG
mmetsp:Transcript_4805/g.12307  ORF Transcript_4805/g.12307 Transcript_4805/m.12307 type:complete len:227 (-) Transcript_4805:155-835(-)